VRDHVNRETMEPENVEQGLGRGTKWAILLNCHDDRVAIKWGETKSR